MCRMEFAESRRATLGVEWELALVDPASGDLVGRAAELVSAIDDPRVVGEFLTNTIELVTGVHERVTDATEELRQLRQAVVRAADPMGVAAIGIGTHPFADWHVQTVVPDERYLRVIDRAKQWGRQLAIWGVHVHVGVPSTDYVADVIGAALADYPLFLALSASSPFWEGQDTGFASHRTMLFQQLPTGGLPPSFRDWAEIERKTEGLINAGVIVDERELRWDVRPSSRYGTVEIRIADSMSTVSEIGAVTALAQCVAEEAMRAVDNGWPARRLPDWAVQENKFRAARYGLNTQFIIDAEGAVQHGREVLARRIDELQPIARDLDCEAKLISALAIGNDTNAERQRALMRSSGRHGLIDAMRADFLR